MLPVFRIATNLSKIDFDGVACPWFGWGSSPVNVTYSHNDGCKMV